MPTIWISLLTVICSSCAFADSNSPSWQLRDILRLTAQKIDQDDSSVKNARLELEMLEALNKTRVELRPQLSLLSFSNPLLLAASLGGSLSINRRTAPTPANMELARLGVVEAEIQHASRRINAQIDVIHQFFILAQAQGLATQSCETWQQEKAGRERVERLVALNRMTKLDVIQFDQEMIDLESDCAEAGSQARSAALTLGKLAGITIATGNAELAVADLRTVAIPSALPPVDSLLKRLFETREELKDLPEHIAQLASPHRAAKLQFDSFSVGYGYLKNVVGETPLTNQYLLGGNITHLDGGFYLPLRNTGADAATRSFLQARFEGLQHDLEAVKFTLRNEVEMDAERTSIASARLKIARERAALASEVQTVVAVRKSQGLQSESDEIKTKRASALAFAALMRVELEWKRQFFTIMALCEPENIPGIKADQIAAASIQAEQSQSVGPAAEIAPTKELARLIALTEGQTASSEFTQPMATKPSVAKLIAARWKSALEKVDK
jgi:hypothetical protein